MIYMCGSNLETQCTQAGADIEEIEEADFDSRYSNVVMMPCGSQTMYRETGETLYANLDFCPGYTAYIRRFGSYLLGKSFVSWRNIQTQAEQTEQGQLISAQLTPEQMQNFASAQLIVLQSMTPPGVESNGYGQVYVTADVSLDAQGRLAARYDNETVELNASAYAYASNVAFEYHVLDTGEYVVEGMVSNSQDIDWLYSKPVLGNYIKDREVEGDARRVRLLFSPPDGEGNLTFKGAYVYDALTGDYTTRTDFELQDYLYLVGVTLTRYERRDIEGALMPYAQWPAVRREDDSPHSIVIILPLRKDMSVNEYSLRDDGDGPAVVSSAPMRAGDLTCRISRSKLRSWRYAAFQITDSQNNTYTTELVPLDSSYMVFADAQAEVAPSDMLSAEAYCVIADEREVRLYVNVTNRSKTSVRLNLEGIAVNGRADQVSRVVSDGKIVAPGETHCLYVSFERGAFKNDRRLERIDFKVRASGLLSGLTFEVVDGSLTMDEDISAVGGWVTIPMQ